MADVHMDISTERAAVRATLEHVGPDAPTACGDWTAHDLVIHLVTGELGAGLANAPFRWLVAHGVRLDRMAPLNRRVLASYRRAHGFDWALRRLDRPPPRPHLRGAVAPVTLLEWWAHHEDLLAPNDVGPCPSDVDLLPVIEVLVRYQRRLLDQYGVRVASGAQVFHEPGSAPRARVEGELADVARWLAGRATLDPATAAGAGMAIPLRI